MSTKTALSPRLYFSYSQFMVYDQSVQLPGCDWAEEHTAQGFARRESVVNFNTPLEFGYADVSVSHEAYQPQQEYQRVQRQLHFPSIAPSISPIRNRASPRLL